MTTSTLIFYPEIYSGFNKTQLLERNLFKAGMIGSKFGSGSFFSPGKKFRHFIPKVDSIHQYQHRLIRIQIQSVGAWVSVASKISVLERSNIILVEGDVIGYPLDRYASLCALLHDVTGDQYQVDVSCEAVLHGISDAPKSYRVNLYSEFVS